MAWLRVTRVFLITTAASVLIVMAIMFSIMRAMLPHATGYLEAVQQEISAEIGLPVKIASIDADMHWLIPRLKMIDLIIYKENAKDELIHLKEANFSLDYINSIRFLRLTIGSIELVGAKLFIERHKDNRWLVQGLAFSANKNTDTNHTSQLIETLKGMNFSLLDNDVQWRDFTGETENLDLEGVDVKVESFFGNHSFDVRLVLPQRYGDNLQVTAELEGDILDYERLKGKVFFSGVGLNIKKWLHELKLENGLVIAGKADASIWLDFSQRKIKKISGKLSNNGLVIRANGKRAKQWDVQSIDLAFLYRRLSNGWRLDIKDLHLSREDKKWLHSSNLLIKNTSDIGFLLSSDYLRLQDIMPLVEVVSDYAESADYQQLGFDDVSGDIYNLNLQLKPENNKRLISAAFEDLDFHLTENKLKAAGLDGVILVNDNEVKLALDSKHISIDIADMFRAPIELDTFTGDISLIFDNHNFNLNSSYLSASNPHLNLTSRIDMKSTDSGNLLDMQVDFFDVDTQYLHRYYPVSVLSKGLIAWLDAAINEGHVSKGSYVFRGDTAAFPFSNNEGVMEVDFAVENLKLHYLDGWPNLQKLDANVRFYNESLQIENGQGLMLGSHVEQVSASIAKLESPVLLVEGKTQSQANKLQEFVWQSGLNDILGDALREFAMKGKAGLDFDLKVPLDDTDNISTNGKLTFADARLDYPALDYRLTGINGSLMFTEANMSADNIKAKFGSSPIEIDVVPVSTSEISESVFYIKGDVEIDELLSSFEWVPDHWLSGRSDWKIGIHVPYSDVSYKVRIDAQSSMKGASVNISDGLKKPVKAALPVALEMHVFDDGLQLDVASEGRFNVSAYRDGKDDWEADIDSSFISGSTRFKQSLETDSTIYMNLTSLTLDAFAMTENSVNDGRNSLLPSSIPSLRMLSKKLFWKNWKLNDISLTTDWHPHGMVISDFKVNGPSLFVSGQGSWLYSWQRIHESNFKIKLVSDNLGHTLSELDITSYLKRSKLSSVSDWQWQAAPYEFLWSKLKGSSEVELSEGIMQEIDPGAGGRILGLFNVLQLPKRFVGDFGDVYKDGFAFDKVTGKFDFNEGNAKTSRVDITAAAANMKMFGRIGMQNRDYDLNIIVKPHSTAATFTGGTLAGGPVVGAALVVIQELFGIDKMSYDKYTITGLWDNPVVTQISKREE